MEENLEEKKVETEVESGKIDLSKIEERLAALEKMSAVVERHSDFITDFTATLEENKTNEPIVETLKW